MKINIFLKILLILALLYQGTKIDSSVYAIDEDIGVGGYSTKISK